MNGYQELDGLFRGHFPLQFDNLDDLGVPHGTPILGMKQIIGKRWAPKKKYISVGPNLEFLQKIDLWCGQTSDMSLKSCSEILFMHNTCE